MSLQDLNKQNSGVTTVSSGPLIIRTYNDQSGNNTYLLSKYEYPVSSNYVLITSSSGQLVPTDAIYVSSVTASTISVKNGFFSSLTGLTERVSTISSNTINVASTIVTSSITATNISTSFFVTTYKLNGSTLTCNNVITSDVTTSTLEASTTTIDTVLTSIITAPILSGLSSVYINPSIQTSSITTSSITSNNSNNNYLTNNSTITGSTIQCTTLISNNIQYSTLKGSSIITNAISASTVTISSLSSINSQSNYLINTSTLTGSTIQCSTVNTKFITYSTIIGSTISTNTITVQSSLTISTIINTSQINMVIGATNLITLVASGIQYNAAYAPSFSAYNSPTTVGTSATAIVWSSTDWNIGAAYAVGTGIFTCPVNAPGVYSVNVGIAPATSNTSIAITVYISGIAYRTLNINNAGTESGSPLNCLVHLQATNTVQIYCGFGTSQAINNTGAGLNSFFQMCWLRSY